MFNIHSMPKFSANCSSKIFHNMFWVKGSECSQYMTVNLDKNVNRCFLAIFIAFALELQRVGWWIYGCNCDSSLTRIGLVKENWSQRKSSVAGMLSSAYFNVKIMWNWLQISHQGGPIKIHRLFIAYTCNICTIQCNIEMHIRGYGVFDIDDVERNDL